MEVEIVNKSVPLPLRQFFHKVLTDDNFHFTIDQWFINETYATAAYGHISDWNTSAVTDMSKAFKTEPHLTRT